MEEIKLDKTKASNWSESLTEEDKSYYFHKENNKISDSSEQINPYKFNENINSKIFLINSDILNLYNNKELELNLPIDALVLQTPKILSKATYPYRQKVLRECGNTLLDELLSIPSLSLSECVITSTHNLSSLFNKIIHVVLPKYTTSYKNACEGSLHLSIRNAFDVSIQNNIRTLCFGYEILKPSKNFPVMTAITVVCRTIRKCLEKLSSKFDKIVFCFEDKELFAKFRETFKLYFPRNYDEETFYAKFLPNIIETEYGDIVLPQRKIDVKTEFSVLKNNFYENENNCVNVSQKSVETYYTLENNDIRDYKIYRNDKQRLKESVLNSHDFSKHFYFEKTKFLTDDLTKTFDKLNFFHFKGTDILQRQILYFHLDRINFYDIDNNYQTEPLIVYLTRYLKQNLFSLDRIFIIVFCENIERKNFPTISFIKTVMKILYSSSVINYVGNFSTSQIVFYIPSFVFKLYIYFLRIYIEKEIWGQIEFCNNKGEGNEKFGLEF